MLRTIRVSPRKLDLVAATIRGKKAASAVNELTFSKKRIAKDVKKALNSAIANAENNHNLDVDGLIVAEASVGKGLVMKRFQTRGRGRAAGIVKPFAISRLWCASAPRRRTSNGSEGQSHRPAARYQPDLGFALVAEGGEYSKMLHEDIHIRKVLRKKLAQAGVARSSSSGRPSAPASRSTPPVRAS